MGNLNKDNQGVFLNVVGSSSSIPEYEQFINKQVQDLHPEYCLANYIAEYTSKVQQHKLDIQQLAHLETIIMQIRALSNMAGNVKLYTVRNKYIYARCPFHRNETEINEIRLLIDLIDLQFPKGSTVDLNILFGKKDYMNKVYRKMKIAMCIELNGNINDYKKIYSK